MIVILSGTNRNNSNTLKISKIAESHLKKNGAETQLLDLNQLPQATFEPKSYDQPPPGIKPFQEKILNSKGIVTVVPEYNGSFPGVLKFFIDLLKFPESFKNLPCSFIGLAAGSFGSFRSVEQLQMIYQYREAYLFNKRVLIPEVDKKNKRLWG